MGEPQTALIPNHIHARTGSPARESQEFNYGNVHQT